MHATWLHISSCTHASWFPGLRCDQYLPSHLANFYALIGSSLAPPHDVPWDVPWHWPYLSRGVEPNHIYRDSSVQVIHTWSNSTNNRSLLMLFLLFPWISLLVVPPSTLLYSVFGELLLFYTCSFYITFFVNPHLALSYHLTSLQGVGRKLLGYSESQTLAQSFNTCLWNEYY